MADVNLKADSSNTALIPELDEYRRQFEAIKQDASELLDGLTDEQFNRRESPGRWSIAECLVHLNVTGRLYLPFIEGAIKEARERQLVGEGPFRQGLLVNWLIRSTEPPAKLKFKAPKIFIPPPDQPLDKVRSDFMALQDALMALVNASNGLHLWRIKVTSPVSRLFKTSLGQCFAFHAAHERRHLWQARQVRIKGMMKDECGMMN
jgi:DinB superfamily